MTIHRAIEFFLTLILFGFVITGYGNQPYRILVSTDIGGTDFDDYQSMVHLFLYADTIDLEGIVSSPYGEGRKSHILEAIDAYGKDYPALKNHSEKYPTADSLRKITKQGALDDPGPKGFGLPTEGSEWIVTCARKNDSRPLYVLVWGGIEDLAQALHDAPDILPKIRVFFIGGPNKKWSVNAYQYVAEHFPTLWMIESNATYRGWFTGGNQSGHYGNQSFVETCIRPYGAMGKYFYEKGATLKMGDTPTLAYFLHGTPEDPSQPGWGGRHVRAWDRPYKLFNRMTNASDSIEEFGVVEFRLPFAEQQVLNPYAVLKIDRPIPGEIRNNTVRFLFSPKSRASYPYTIESNIPSVNGLSGSIRSYATPASNKSKPSPVYPNWWVDDPSPEYIEKDNIGVKTLTIWREAFLDDFARRMKRCEAKTR